MGAFDILGRPPVFGDKEQIHEINERVQDAIEAEERLALGLQKYSVEFSIDGTITIEVEAKNSEEAKLMADDEFNAMSDSDILDDMDINISSITVRP